MRFHAESDLDAVKRAKILEVLDVAVWQTYDQVADKSGVSRYQVRLLIHRLTQTGKAEERVTPRYKKSGLVSSFRRRIPSGATKN